jgi:coenzyme F420 hydrogenase subunit beta
MKLELEVIGKNDLCSGCGLCSSISEDVKMDLSADGYLRPCHIGAEVPTSSGPSTDQLKRACPALTVSAPLAVDQPDARRDEIFGSYISVWQAWASNDDIRYAGSSGGVLTAISQWLLDTRESTKIATAVADPTFPNRTNAVTYSDKRDVVNSAGSRYAPVAVVSEAAVQGSPKTTVVGKPCEIAAVRAFHAERPVETPLLLSFFCAGVPSQNATDGLVTKLSENLEDVDTVRYRGNGWPGEFTVADTRGGTATMSYEQSWGTELGPSMQWRCKLCPDGVGESADIAVGDYWTSDESGYPVFENQAGRSVVIARTARGEEMLQKAIIQGIIVAEELDIKEVYSVQPLQVSRRQTMVGRLVGARAAGLKVPLYKGFGLLRLAAKHPVSNSRQALGTYRRARVLRRRKRA